MTHTAPPQDTTNDPTGSWSHLKETINMLYLAVCQIEATLIDSNTSVDTLTHSFSTLAEHTSDLSQQIQTLNKIEELDKFKADLLSTAQEIHANIFGSVQAFQFYDRVCQRLDHVARSLEKVSNLLEDPNKVVDQQEWSSVQSDIKSSYTMEAERIMFEFIMRGGTVKEALKIYQHHFENNTNNGSDEIEFF